MGSNEPPLKFEAVVFLDVNEIRYPESYIDCETRDPKTKKLGLKRMEPMDLDFSYDSPEESMWPSINITLTTANKKLMHMFYERKMYLKGYKFRVVLEEIT